MGRPKVLAVALAGAAFWLAGQGAAQNPPSLDGVFSQGQGARGAQAFQQFCSTCHAPSEAAGLMVRLGGGETVPAFHAALSAVMPPGDGPRPSPQQYLDIIGFMALQAGAAPGEGNASLTSEKVRAALIPNAVQTAAAAAAKPLEWTHWRGDIGGTGYSPADQIDRTNVRNLKVAWRWTSANYGPSPETRNITTPLMAGGLLYATAGTTRSVVALDPASGETVWVWRPSEPQDRYDNAPRKGAGRGVSYWNNGRDPARIFTVTPGFQLVALDAHTGVPVPRFGRGGKVDLMVGLRNLPAQGLADIGSQSPPLVIGDVVVVGPAHLASLRPRSKENVKGDVRGFDARTGRLLWTFHTIPAKGEPFYDTWAPGSAETSGNAGAWAPLSADPETGAIFVPVESGTSDFYGGERLGDNRNTSSLVSLDARTGRVRWSRQIVRHDIWDMDVPAMPILADIPQPGGGVRKAVLQISKQAFLYAFDRNTGEPLWPMAEYAAPASDVPGERTAPTQSIPTLPLPFDRQGLTPDDLIDFTPQLHAEALEAVRPYRLGRLFSPPSLTDAADGTKGTIGTPGYYGGGNWEGGAFDPETGIMYVASQTNPLMYSLAPGPEGGVRYRSAGGQVPRVRGLPLVRPPYGRITAIDMKSGQHAWMIANADTPAEIRSNPVLKGLDIPRTGVATRAGLLLTRTLLFAGEGAGGAPVFRAHDKATGQILATIPMPGTQTGLPMTYVWQGRQYIVMAVQVPSGAAEIVALALPR